MQFNVASVRWQAEAVFLQIVIDSCFASLTYRVAQKKTSRTFAWRYATQQVKWVSRKACM